MTLGLDSAVLQRLRERPNDLCPGRAAGVDFEASVMIPEYRKRLIEHYGRACSGPVAAPPFDHFGILVDFARPVELVLHDAARTLDEELRSLVSAFGPLVLRNVQLPKESRIAEQRNVFGNLEFHIDRAPSQPDHFTLFWRDPFDEIQRKPRSSSTLVMANAAAYLQAMKEGHGSGEFTKSYRLLENETVAPLKNRILVEIPWRAAEGIGEAAILDNTTVLHASYYERPDLRGYPISVRYLA